MWWSLLFQKSEKQCDFTCIGTQCAYNWYSVLSKLLWCTCELCASLKVPSSPKLLSRAPSIDLYLHLDFGVPDSFTSYELTYIVVFQVKKSIPHIDYITVYTRSVQHFVIVTWTSWTVLGLINHFGVYMVVCLCMQYVRCNVHCATICHILCR